jgi:3-methyladenine DNA glycosylase AlkD
VTKPVNLHHLALIKIFQDHQNLTPNNDWLKKYLGTNKTLYNLKTADKVKLVKSYVKFHITTFSDYLDLLLSLAQGSSFEELSTMGILLGHFPKFRQQLTTSVIDRLFDHVKGWAETDITCSFSAEDLLNNWHEWQKLLDKFVKDANIHKRRASLVLLTNPVRQSSDPRLSKIAFAYVNRLKTEHDILITKAVSWILRSLIKFHQDKVASYLGVNLDTLPKIVLREVSTKLATGRKYVNKKLPVKKLHGQK